MDETLSLLLEGYQFIGNRMNRHQSDVYQTRLLGKDVVCVTGREAAALFYDPSRFARGGAAPLRVQKTLTGVNTVQGLDGEAHARRKALFMALTAEPNPSILAGLAAGEWEAALPRWQAAEQVVLFGEAKQVLCRAACAWAGVPLPEMDAAEYAQGFAAMVDGFGAAGPRHWRGRAARACMERRMANVVANVRAGRLRPPEGSPLAAIANHREPGGGLPDACAAAKELINLLRPITAISTYVAFMALALHTHPACREALQASAGARHRFVQEVRRFYPFTPFVGAVAKQDFAWNGCEFQTGTAVLLDVYGINHDSRLWDRPCEFRPERFRGWQHDPFAFLPHGGGDPAGGHRCPGESITVEVLKATLDFLVNKLAYHVPAQDLSYDLARIPTLPASGFVIRI